MTKASETVPRFPRADADGIARFREQIAAAQERRRIRKHAATQARLEELSAADNEFAAVVIEAREHRVPWNEITAAAGVSRQAIVPLLRSHKPVRNRP